MSTYIFIIKDIDNRRSQLMNQYVREKTDENEVHRTEKAKTRHTDLEAKQHEDQLRHLEVGKRHLSLIFLDPFLESG